MYKCVMMLVAYTVVEAKYIVRTIDFDHCEPRLIVKPFKQMVDNFGFNLHYKSPLTGDETYLRNFNTASVLERTCSFSYI